MCKGVRDINNNILNWLPILCISIFVFNSDRVTLFSHTIIGRTFAALLIIYYASIDRLLGICVCLLVILFYQSDYAKNLVKPFGLGSNV